jgi:hypothetical protein
MPSSRRWKNWPPHTRVALNVVYSRPAAGDVPGRDYQHAGHVDVDLLRRSLPHGRHQFYVCGPPAMMQTLVPALARPGACPSPTSTSKPSVPASVRCRGPRTSRQPAAQRSRCASALRPHAGLERPGREPARLCRTPRPRGRVGLPLRQLRQLRDPAAVDGSVHLRATRPTTTLPRATACCASASRPVGTGAGGLMPRRHESPTVQPRSAALHPASPRWPRPRSLCDGPAPARPAVWIGRWLGIPGTLLIIGSPAYSLRKRKLIKSASPASCCAWHELWPGWVRCWCWCMPASTSMRSWAGWRCGHADQRRQRPDRQVPARPLAPRPGRSAPAHARPQGLPRGARPTSSTGTA